MIRNIFKIAFRVLVRNKTFAMINLIGLVSGLTSFILISLWILDEINYDQFHDDLDQIHVMAQDQFYNGEAHSFGNMPFAIKEHLSSEYPEIIAASRYLYRGNTNYVIDEEGFYEDAIYADPEMFSILTLPLKAGSVENFDKYSAIVSDDFAERHFDGDALGKSILNADKQLVIVGILHAYPSNSFVHGDVFQHVAFQEEFGIDVNAWGSNNPFTLIKVEKNVSMTDFNEKILNTLKEPQETTAELFTHPLKDFHLYNFHYKGNNPVQMVYMIGLLAIFILLIACINFTNLSTAYAATRAKEIGIRKSVGSSKTQLSLQFLGESILLSFAALLGALVLVKLLLPLFNITTAKELSMPLDNPLSYVVLFGIVLVTGVLAGLYPAIYLSRFNPSKVLKSAQIESGNSMFRKVLVVFQFAISIALIVCTLTITDQLHFLKTKDLGFQRENVLHFRITGDAYQKSRFLKNKISQLPGVVAVTTATHIPNSVYSNGGTLEWAGKDPDINPFYSYFGVNKDFDKVFDMQLLQGELFTGSAADSSWTNVIVNENFAEIIGNSALHTELQFPSGSSHTIVGIINNFDFVRLSQNAGPLFVYYTETGDNFFVRTNGTNTGQLIEDISSLNKEYYPEEPIEISFLDETVNNAYKKEERLARVFYMFVVIAVIISALGLYGLSLFTAQRRKKEIAIRKVMGASVSHILYKMNSDFLVLVLIGNLIAIPAAIWYLDGWLEDFANRVGISVLLLVVAVVLSFILAIFTVSAQSLKVALHNPVDSLKEE